MSLWFSWSKKRWMKRRSKYWPTGWRIFTSASKALEISDVKFTNTLCSVVHSDLFHFLAHCVKHEEQKLGVNTSYPQNDKFWCNSRQFRHEKAVHSPVGETDFWTEQTFAQKYFFSHFRWQKARGKSFAMINWSWNLPSHAINGSWKQKEKNGNYEVWVGQVSL